MKGMPIPHLAKESTGGKGFSFIKTQCYHQPKIGKALGELGRNSRQQRIPEIESNYWHTKSSAVISVANPMDITNTNTEDKQQH